MTAIELLEAYSAAHPETIEELLEWPYRRVLAASEAWQRRALVEEWNQRKLAHIAGMQTIDLSEPERRQDFINEISDGYEEIKRDIMLTAKERTAIEEEYEGSDFIRAGRRSVAKILANVEDSVLMPGMEAIHRLP